MTPTERTIDIEAHLQALAERVEGPLTAWTAGADVPAPLAEAMRYAVLGGGKRLRPAMVMLSAQAVSGGGVPATDPLPAAVAIELVHTYSLVHDDLPAMDDDTLRRGRPTVHVRFGEAMAILAGDALLTQAFTVLVEHVEDAAVAASLVAELARAAGPAGMIAGQVADMDLCPLPGGESALEYIHRRKTAAMFAGAARMGAICGLADVATVDALGAFAEGLGLAFQIVDDILDATATREQLGKTPGKDAAAGKRTYPAMIGLEVSAQRAAAISRQALAHLDGLGPASEPLRALARLLLDRQS